MITTIHDLAARLNGRQYRSEITRAEIEAAKDRDFVVIFGASDDLIEFRGALDEEIGCYNGGEIELYYDENGQLCVYQANEEDEEIAASIGWIAPAIESTIQVDWSTKGYSWFITVEDSFWNVAYFDVMDGDEKYCRGAVISRVSQRFCCRC